MIRFVLVALSLATLTSSVCGDEASLKELRQQKLALLAERVELVEAGHKAGRVQLEAVLDARAEYLGTALELAESREARIAILKQAVALAEQRVEITRARHEALGGREDVLQAQLKLLDCKIALELETSR